MSPLTISLTISLEIIVVKGTIIPWSISLKKICKMELFNSITLKTPNKNGSGSEKFILHSGGGQRSD